MMNKEMLIDDYMEYLNRLGKSKETIRSYKSCVNRFFNDVEIEDIKELNNLNSEFFLDYASSLRDKISVATINKLLRQLSSFWDYLIFKDYVEKNVVKNTPSLNNNVSEYKEKVLSEEQIKAIIKSTDEFPMYDYRNSLRDKAIIYLLINTAIRINELSRIRVKDLELDNKKLWVRGKGHGGEISRFSFFNDKTKELLVELINKNPNREYLFENYKHEQLSDQTIRKIWYRACEIADVKGFTPHGVRHRMGSILVSQDVPVEKVAQVLGHSNINTCQKYYVKPKDEIAEVLNVADVF